jgi:predicted MFS family arabinose efflux permease
VSRIDPTSISEPQRLFTLQFGLVSAAQFFCYASNLMVDPLLSLYLTGVGYSTSVAGVIIAAFSVMSFMTRPFVGRGVDVWSPRYIYAIGGLALATGSFSYMIPVLGLIAFTRMIHGLGWGCINTAGPALATEAVPPWRRGEALGYFSAMPSLAAIGAPALAYWLAAERGFPTVFVVSGCVALMAAFTAWCVRDPDRSPAGSVAAGSFWSTLIEPAVWLPTALNLLFTVTQSATTIYMALYARSRGIEDVSVYFLVSGLTLFGFGLLARWSDRWGRSPVIAVSFLAGMFGVVAILFADTLLVLATGGMLLGIGFGLLSPTLIAFAVDKAPPNRRGAGLATFTASYQLAYATAALFWGFVIDRWGFEAMFQMAFAPLLLGFLLMLRNWQAGAALRAA